MSGKLLFFARILRVRRVCRYRSFVRAIAIPLVIFGVAAAQAARSAEPARVAAGNPCAPAIAAAERSWRLPAGLLPAIARVESGRLDPQTGVVHPWPWTINAEGTGHFFDTKEEAIAAVSALQARGVRSVDVGCMQVNLLHHPLAFATLDDAFDPQANAHYAGNFLNALNRQTGSWPLAAAAYHSQTVEIAADYQRLVMAAWGRPELATLGRSGPEPARVELPAAIRAVLPQQDALRAFMPQQAALRSFGRTERVAHLTLTAQAGRRPPLHRLSMASLRPERLSSAR